MMTSLQKKILVLFIFSIIIIIWILYNDSTITQPNDSTIIQPNKSTIIQPNKSTITQPIFASNTTKNTGFNDRGGGNTIFLDRHNLNCDSNGINSFILVNDGKGNMRYDYNCSSGGNLQKLSDKDTGFNSDGGGNIIYLDRHNIDCGSNSALAQFNLIRNNNNQLRYNYKCLSSNDPLYCRNMTTTPGKATGKTSDLKTQNLSCNNDEVISSFKLTRPTNDSIAYQYKCCKY